MTKSTWIFIEESKERFSWMLIFKLFLVFIVNILVIWLSTKYPIRSYEYLRIILLDEVIGSKVVFYINPIQEILFIVIIFVYFYFEHAISNKFFHINSIIKQFQLLMVGVGIIILFRKCYCNLWSFIKYRVVGIILKIF